MKNMAPTKALVRQSVSLPLDVARHVRAMARSRQLSANQALVELIQQGIEAQQRQREEFFFLAG